MKQIRRVSLTLYKAELFSCEIAIQISTTVRYNCCTGNL